MTDHPAPAPRPDVEAIRAMLTERQTIIDRIQGGYRLHGVGYRTKAQARRRLRWYRNADAVYGEMVDMLSSGPPFRPAHRTRIFADWLKRGVPVYPREGSA